MAASSASAASLAISAGPPVPTSAGGSPPPLVAGDAALSPLKSEVNIDEDPLLFMLPPGVASTVEMAFVPSPVAREKLGWLAVKEPGVPPPPAGAETVDAA